MEFVVVGSATPVRRLLIKAALPLAAALVTALVVTYVFFLRPWLVWPDEPLEKIERRWHQARTWAGARADGGAEPSLEARALLAAAERLRRQHRRLTQLFLQDGREDRRIRWRIERHTLPEDVRDGLDKLRRWHRSGKPLVTGDCTSSSPMLGMHILGRLALASAPSPDDEQAVAALHLARAVRSSPIGLAVGLALARDALDWAAGRDPRPDRLLARYRPEPSELFEVIAREVVCYVELIERDGNGQPTGKRRPPLLARLADPGREVAMLKRYYASRLARLHKHRHHLGRLNAALQVDQPHELPKSAVVQALARAIEPSWAHLASLMRETTARYAKQ